MSVSFHSQCLDGIVTVIQGLDLDDDNDADLPGSSVQKARLVDVRPDMVKPAVIVSEAPLPETLDPNGEMANTDDVGYPCAVTICLAANQDFAVHDYELLWRQLIAGAFHKQRPAALVAAVTPAVFQYSRWEPGAVIDVAQFFGANVWLSTMVIRCVVRKTRP